MAEPRAVRRRQESTVAKVIRKQPVYREIASALRADAKLIAAYVERRALEHPSMPAMKFAAMVKAEIVAMQHYDEPRVGGAAP